MLEKIMTKPANYLNAKTPPQVCRLYKIPFIQNRYWQSYKTAKIPSVFWHCWLGGRKGIWPVKTVVGCWCGFLHMAQLMPLALTVSCFSKILIGFTFLVPAHPGSHGQTAVKRVCVCVCVCACVRACVCVYKTAEHVPNPNDARFDSDVHGWFQSNRTAQLNTNNSQNITSCVTAHSNKMCFQKFCYFP